MTRFRWARTITPLGLLVLVSAGCDSAQSPAVTASAAVPAASPSSPSGDPSSSPASGDVPAEPSPSGTVSTQPVPGGPTLLRGGIALRKVADVTPYGIRLLRNPADGEVYLLNPASGLSRVDLATGTLTPVADSRDIVDGVPAGMSFAPDGTAYVVGNRAAGKRTTHAVIRRGEPTANGGFTWSTVATTDEYPLAEGPFNHVFNGITVSPDGSSLFVNSGSRTDHGEVEDNAGAFPATREMPLTSAIFRIPADSANLVLHNTEKALKPYLYADGTRNAFSLAFAPTGELFATDNGPDADFPDELNLVEAGKHYGFPWRFGSQDNPQALPGYDPKKDVRIQPESSAYKQNTYRNDPTFPKAPSAFVDALANSGPGAVQYRDDNGKAANAADDGSTVATFTPHRSPLGLVFTDKAYGSNADGDLHALLLSWGTTIGDLPDRGQDLQALTLTKSGATYTVATEQLATGFKFPIDEVLVDGHLYVLEFGEGGAIWELTFA
ncbi:MAG: Cytochrome c class [Frankiales bacterium]|nr:Cytochrome c class [Frankiales bacterium]